MEPATQEFSPHKFRETTKEALAVSATYIRDAILGNVDLSDYLIKGDKTAVTVVDMESQARALPIIKRDLGQYRLNAEETEGDSGDLSSNIRIYFDPLDGTGGFLIGGPTPTIILGAYDSSQKQVLAVATMEPITGRFWFSAKDEGAWLNKFDYHAEKWTSEDGKQIQVNDHERLKGSHVLVDVNHAFSRLSGTKPILTANGRRTLTSELEAAGAKETTFYTNGGHYALVATGRPTLVGNITTAIGGPFDVAGLLHVIEAGGVAQCYDILEGAPRLLRQLEHSQDIEAADIVIAANKAETLKTLERVVSTGVGHHS